MTDLALDERSPFGIAVRWEHRSDLANYSQSTILHPNGTPICSAHSGFVGTVARLLFASTTGETQ